ncbi:MAG: hypothetical protein AAF589_01540 [Planctomycetota bacterium]
MQVVAIDWDSDSARAAVALRRPSGGTLTRVVQLDAAGDAGELAGQLRDTLSEVKWSKARVLVVIGGDRVGFRLLKLPPTPDSELPDMVRLLAEKEFGSSDGVVDYVPLSGDATTPRSVLAARAPQATLDAVARLTDALDTTAARIVLRACGAGSLAARLDESLSSVPALVAAPAGEASDLIVLDDGLPAIIRTAKTDHQADAEVPVDVRRTLSSAAVQLGRPINRTFSFASPNREDANRLADAASKWRVAGDEAANIAGAAAVVGAVLDEADRVAPAIDLLAPRQATVDQTPRRTQLLYAGLAASIVLAVGWFGYRSIASLDGQIARVKQSTLEEKKVVQKLAPELKQVEAIDRWAATDVNWLDELEVLGRRMRPEPLSSKEFPADNDLMLSRFTATATQGRRGSGGSITLDAVARDADASTLLEERVSDDTRRVEQGSLDQSGQGKYRWRLKPTIRVTPATEDAT